MQTSGKFDKHAVRQSSTLNTISMPFNILERVAL